MTDLVKRMAEAEAWLRERYGAERAHPEWRALAEAFEAGRASPQPAVPEGFTLSDMREFCGFLSAAIPELHNVKVPLIADALDLWRLRRLESAISSAFTAAPEPK